MGKKNQSQAYGGRREMAAACCHPNASWHDLGGNQEKASDVEALCASGYECAPHGFASDHQYK